MSGTGSWLQFANRMNKFKGSYFQDFADISGNLIVRNTGNVYLHAGSNMYMTSGDISMNGFMYCKGVVDLSGNSLSGGGDGGGGGLTSVSSVNIKSLNTTDFVTTGGYATIGNYLNVTGSTTLNGQLTANGNSIFNGQLDGSGASFNSMSVGDIELKGSIIPDVNATYDIGSADKKIRDLYVSNSSIWIGDNNKLAVENDKITMKKRKMGDNDIPKFIRDKISFVSLADKITHVKTFASSNSLGKTSSDLLSTYTVADWIRFANKKGALGQDGFTKTNHVASDIYDIVNDFNNEDNGQWTTVSTGVINYDGKITVGSDVNTAALETLGKTTLLGNVAIGGYSNSNAELYINGNTVNSGGFEVTGTTHLSTTNVGASLTVSHNANITGKLGVGKLADGSHHLDVLGKTRLQDDAYFKKSLLVGTGVNTTSLATNNSTGASLYVETPLVAGSYPDISHNVVLNVPNTVFKAQDNTIITNTNSLVIDATNRSILPYVRDVNGDLVNTGMTNGWVLGGPGANRFDAIHARDISISTETINIEDGSGNKIGMSFDATTGSVNYTVVTKDTADASGETFVIKGVQTQKISSGGGTIDPALLEFTGLSFGDTFDSTLVYDLSTTYTYNLSTTTYTGDGTSVFTTSAGAQSLANFATLINEQTLLGSLPTKECAVIRVGVDDRADGGLNGIDTVGNKVDLTNKIVSVTDDDGGSTLKWTLWGSEAELNAPTAGNYLNYIELKNINMASGTYFVAKTSGTIVYNNATQEFLTNDDMIGVVNGDLFLYIDRSPGNNWTKIPVSLPASGSITTQMLTDSVIQPGKIATNAITESKILDGAVTTSKIADASITAIKFKAGEINGTIFDNDAIDGAKIGGNIATSKLVGDISGSLIADNTIVSSKIVDGTITSAKIAYLGVSGDNLMADSVTTTKIADGAVITGKIPDGAITSAKLAPYAIDASNLLVNGIITTEKILGGAVTEEKLASLSVGSVNIKDDAITETKIADGSVTLAKINGSVFSGKQDTLVAGTGISIDPGTNTISSTASTSIATGGITTDLIADGAITLSKLADGVSIGSGGGSSGGGSSGGDIALGDVTPNESVYIDYASIKGWLPNQELGTFGDGSNARWFGNIVSSLSMNDDLTLAVANDKNKNLYIFDILSDKSLSVKQTITFTSTEFYGYDIPIISSDGTTIVGIPRVIGTHSTSVYSKGGIYIYHDPSANWDSIPSQVKLTNDTYGTKFGLNASISSDGSKLAASCVDITNGPVIAIYSTAVTTSTPIMVINLYSVDFPTTAVNTTSFNTQMTSDGSKILIYLKRAYNQPETCYVVSIDYVNLTYNVEFDFVNTAEYLNGAIANNCGSCLGSSISRDGTRLFVPVYQNIASVLTTYYYFYSYESGSWVNKARLSATDVFTAEEITSYTANSAIGPMGLASMCRFGDNNTIIVHAGAAYLATPLFIYTFSYSNGSWINSYKSRKNGLISNNNSYGFSVTSNNHYGFTNRMPVTEQYIGKIQIVEKKAINVNVDVLQTKVLLIDNGIHTFIEGSDADSGTTYSTKFVGNQVISNGSMVITSNVLNSVGTGASMVSTTKNFDNSPILVLAHNSTGTAYDILNRPAIEFRTTKMTSLDTHDWRMYSQGSTGIQSDLILQNGRFVNNIHYRYDMVRFTGSQSGSTGGMVLNYNIIGIEGDATKRQGQCSQGVMTLQPNFSNTYAGIRLLNSATGYPASGTYYAIGLELRTYSTGGGLSSIWCHEDTTHFNRGDMSIMTKTDMNFYTGVQKWSNHGEQDQSAYKRMSIGVDGGVGIGTDSNSDYALSIKGNVNIDGVLNADLVAPLIITETANITANTAVANSNTGSDANLGLGSSNGDKICMSGDGYLTVLANVDLKKVYTFRNVNNVWEDFSTVSADATKYIYKNVQYFGKVIALSRDGLTLAISDRQTVWIYNWNSGTSSWDEGVNTCSDTNYTTNSTSIAFCHNMKITDDGSKLLILSFNSVSDWKLRIYDTATGLSLVTVTDNTSNIDPSAITGNYPGNWNASYKTLQNWFRWQIAMSGDGTVTAISGRATGNSTWFRDTLVYDIDYSVNSSSINSTFNVGSTGKNLNGREISFNNDGTLFVMSVGRGSAFTYASDLDKPRVNMYRRSLLTPTVWTLENEYSPMPELEGLGSYWGYGDGFGEKISMNLDGSVVYIGAHSVEHYALSTPPKQHFIGRVAYKSNNWSNMDVISGPVTSNWALGIVTSSDGAILNVSNLGFNIEVHGGGFHSYNVQLPDLVFTGPKGVILNGGGDVTAGHFKLDSQGNVGIGVDPVSNVKLNVAGDIAASGAITAGSDDRLKENETTIEDAITTIKKLRPEIYDKKPTFDNIVQDEWVRESGLIAQELWYTNPELRHLVTIGSNIKEIKSLRQIKYNDNDGIVKSFYIHHILDPSGNKFNSDDIFVLDDSGNIFIDISGNTHVDKNKFLLLDLSGNEILYNGNQVLDYNKLKNKNITGISYKKIITTPKIDDNGTIITDIDGNAITFDDEVDVVDETGMQLINPLEKLTFEIQPIVVKTKKIETRPKTEMVTEYIHTQVKPEDIQDYTPTDDIQNDPDYKALGWGDTPSQLNYTGLIPYLIKAIQEQQEAIDLLKTEVNSLKNA